MLKSGFQSMREWELAETFIGDLTRAYFDSAVETCSLYEIPLDTRLTKCLEDELRTLIVTQYGNAIKRSECKAVTLRFRFISVGRSPATALAAGFLSSTPHDPARKCTCKKCETS